MKHKHSFGAVHPAGPPHRRDRQYVHEKYRPGDYAGVQRLGVFLRVFGAVLLCAVLVFGGYAFVQYGIPAVQNAVRVSSAASSMVSSAAQASSQLSDESTFAVTGYDDAGLPVYADDFCLQLVNTAHTVSQQENPQLTEYGGVLLDSRILPALQAMEQAAKAQGITWSYASGYVSVQEQQTLFDAKTQQLMEQGMSRILAGSTAAKYVSRPGTADQHTGLSFSLPEGQNTAQDAAYHWLYVNAANYGFILRYPEGEADATGITGNPPVFRYVGTNHAVRMRYLSMCLERYCAYLQNR